jgi:nicotinamide-nucleotide amidase
MLRSKIISIGDEILMGHIVNANAAFIGEKLYSIGIPADKILTIGDKEEPLEAELEDSMKNYDVTILTGGLGPTHDDLTKPVLVKHFNDKLVTDEKILTHIQELFTKRDIKMPEVNKEQALVPSAAKIIWNQYGTAPGLWLEKNDHVVIALPGVPYEMKEMMAGKGMVMDMLTAKFRSKLKYLYKNKALLTTGISESGLYELLGDIKSITGDHNKLAFLPSGVGVKLRMDVRASGFSEADAEIKKMETIIREKAGAYIFGEGEDSLESVIGKMLLKKKYRLAVAESCTGGYLSSTIVNIEGSSEYYLGGVCTYANEAKIKLLNVDPGTIKQHGAVSEQTAMQMAEGVRKRFNSEVSLSTTGIAGPAGGSKEKPVGLVWIGYSDQQKTYARKFLFGKDRIRNIMRATHAAMDMLRKEIL